MARNVSSWCCRIIVKPSNLPFNIGRKQITMRNIVVSYSTGMQAPSFNVRRKRLGPAAWFLLSVPISTFALGVWQIQRKKWKEGLIESLMVKTKIPPIPLPNEDDEVKNLEYRAVTVRGVFDHANEMFLGPRSCLIDGESNVNRGTIISSKVDGVSGYLVVTPFILSDTNQRILVNRGWVPFKQKKAMMRRNGQIEGEVELTGIIRHTEPRPQFSPVNKPDARVWFSRDVEKMAQYAETRPVFIDATVNSSVPGGPIGGQTRSSLRNEHFSYIITWFSLSAATTVMWYFRFVR